MTLNACRKLGAGLAQHGVILAPKADDHLSDEEAAGTVHAIARLWITDWLVA